MERCPLGFHFKLNKQKVIMEKTEGITINIVVKSENKIRSFSRHDKIHIINKYIALLYQRSGHAVQSCQSEFEIA